MGVNMKLLAIDLDGTLLNREDCISDFSRDVLRQCEIQGVHVCLVTGRIMARMIDYYNYLGLRSSFVVANGSEVWSSPEKCICTSGIAQEDVTRIFDLIKNYNVKFWSNKADELDWDTEAYWINEFHCVRDGWLRFEIYVGNEPRRDNLFLKLKELLPSYSVFRTSEMYFDILANNTSKLTGLQKLCANLQIDLKDVIAFGDELNDLAMLQAVGKSIVPNNAVLEVQAIATEICNRSNQEDAVAHWIYRNVLNI